MMLEVAKIPVPGGSGAVHALNNVPEQHVPEIICPTLILGVLPLEPNFQE